MLLARHPFAAGCLSPLANCCCCCCCCSTTTTTATDSRLSAPAPWTIPLPPIAQGVSFTRSSGIQKEACVCLHAFAFRCLLESVSRPRQPTHLAVGDVSVPQQRHADSTRNRSFSQPQLGWSRCCWTASYSLPVLYISPHHRKTTVDCT